jgi:O-antigen/teichoic acid export membrane protein
MDKPEELSAGKNMAWSTFGSVVDLACQWLISVAIVRITSSFSDAGIYALATSIYGIVHPIAQFKMYTYHLSDVDGEYSFGEYLGFNAFTCFAALFCCVLYSVITGSFSSLAAIVLYSLYRLSKVTIDVFHAENQRNGRMDYIGISLALQGVLSLISFSFAYFFSQSLSFGLGSMVLMVVCVGFFYDRPHTAAFVHIQMGIKRDKAICLARKCLPVVLGGIACSLAPAIPKQVLQSVSGDAALGIYASVAAPVAIIQMGANYIYYPLLGYFAKYHQSGDLVKFRKLLVLVTFAIAACGVVCVFALNIIGVDVLVLVFGSKIQEYGYLLTPVIVASLITAYMWFLTDLLVSVRGLNLTVVGNAISLIATILISYPFISSFGMNGVSYVLILSYLISTIFMLMGLLKNVF